MPLKRVASAIFAYFSVLSIYTMTIYADEVDIPITISCNSTSANAGQIAPNELLDGSWNRPRRDAGLTGRSPLVGSITCPQALWQIDISKYGNWLELEPATGSTSQQLSSNDAGNYAGARSLFDFEGALIDLNNDGWFIEKSSSSNHTAGDFLDSIPGFEKIHCDYSANGGGETPGSCFLSKWVDTQWVEVWKSQPLDQSFSHTQNSSHPIVADIDNDGELEVSITMWYVVHVLDLATGALEYTGQFTDPDNSIGMSGRPYGLQAVVDITGDARKEIIILSDFLPTIQVLGWNDNNELVELWDRVFETFITINRTIHQVSARPMGDVTGDGFPEILTNVFNETGDGRWHLLVLDAATGDEVVNLVDRFLAGSWDLDGDGIVELLINETNGQAINERGPAIVASVKNGQFVERARLANQAFEWTTHKGFEDTINGGTSTANSAGILHPAVLRNWNGLNSVFITRDDTQSPEVTLTLWSFDGTDVTEEAAITGPDLKIIGTEANDGSQAFMVRTAFEQFSTGDVSLSNLNVRNLHAGRIGVGSGPIVTSGSLLSGTIVSTVENDQRLVVTQGFGDAIQAYEVDTINATQILRWETSGHGMISGMSGVNLVDNGVASIAAYDPFGTGISHFLIANKNEDGAGQLVSITPDGNVLWSKNFGVLGDMPVWNNSGITHWAGGNFISATSEDLYVVARRSNMHDDELFLIDGKNGSTVWSRSEGGVHNNCVPLEISGPSPYQAALVDWNNDGLDDITDLAYSSLSAFSGVDGSLLINKWVNKYCGGTEIIFSFDSHSSQIVGIADSLAPGGEKNIIWGGNSQNLGLLNLDGTAAWGTPTGEGMPANTLQIAADLDGDGRREIVVIGHCGTPGSEIRAYNSEDGSLRWSMSNSDICDWPSPPAPSAADLDGDGKEEVVYTHRSTVVVLAEENNAGVERWSVVLQEDNWWPFALGSPVIADVDGWGLPQILLNTANGYLLSLGIPDPDDNGNGIPDRIDAIPPNTYNSATGLIDIKLNAAGLGLYNLSFVIIATEPEVIIQVEIASAVEITRAVDKMATFDSTTGVLTLPELAVDGSVSFGNLVFSLSDPDKLQFTLTSFEEL